MGESEESQYPEESKPYQPFGAARDLFYARDKEILLVGAAGTGKSRGALEKGHLLMMKYPASRGLLLRKTRESMSQSTLVTWEEKVVQRGFFGDDGASRSHKQSYVYPNGSEMVVGGMDKSTKILSTEYDWIFCDEATEIAENDWEVLLTRLRNHKIPYQQAIAGCNPDAPSHWLNQRANKGQMRRLTSLHKDNPSVTQDYLDTLDRLTGVRRLRFRDGVWAAAEGRIYENYNPSIHLIDLDVPKSYFANGFFVSVDWGFRHAGVMQVWGLDADDRMYLVHEVFQTGRTIDWWTDQAKKLATVFGVSTFVCDSARPDYIEQLRKKGGVNAIEAYKSVMIGIQAVTDRLDVQADGKARLFILNDSLPVKERDQSLIEAKKPWCTAQEFDSYVWDASVSGVRKEAPLKINDDGMDCMRYAVAYADHLGSGAMVARRA